MLLSRPLSLRSRDAALRSLALSCKEGLALYYPELIRRVTISLLNIIELCDILCKDDRKNGKLIKSLYCTIAPAKVSEEAKVELLQQIYDSSDLPSSSSRVTHVQNGLFNLVRSIFNNTTHLEVLIIEDPRFFFHFLRVEGVSPLPFLANTLKTLYMIAGDRSDEALPLSARNGVWLLLFLPHLREAALGISISYREDCKYLRDHSSVWEGLSNVKELSLDFRYDYDENDSKTWWSLPRDLSQTVIGNRKTEAVMQILSITKELVSLEIFNEERVPNPGDESRTRTDCLTVLGKSFETLKNLRIFGLLYDPVTDTPANLSNFKILKSMTVELNGLYLLAQTPKEFLPSSLEVLTLHSHVIIPKHVPVDQFHEEIFLGDAIFIKRRHLFPKLKEIRVPLGPSDMDGNPIGTDEQKGTWAEKRESLKRKLEEDETVKLKTFGPKEIGE